MVLRFELTQEYNLSFYYKTVLRVDGSNFKEILIKTNNKLRTLENNSKVNCKNACVLLDENIENFSSSLEYLTQLDVLINYDIFINDKFYFEILKNYNFNVFRYYPSTDFSVYNKFIDKPFSVRATLVKKHFTNLSNSVHDHNYYMHKFFIENNLLQDTVWSYQNYKDEFAENYNKFLNLEKNNYETFVEKIWPGSSENNEMTEVDIDLHRMSAITINKETVFHGHGPHYSEKLIKCLASGRPFIEVSSPGTLKDLKEQFGIKTFSDLIDESYDTITNPKDRLNKIFNEIKKLSKLSLKQLQYYILLKEKDLKHNFEIGKHLYLTAKNKHPKDIHNE